MPDTETNSLVPEINPFIIDRFNRKIRNIVTVRPNVTSYPFLKLSEDFLVSGVLECDATVTTVAGDAGETTLASYTIPLSTISRNYGGTGTSGKDFRKAGNAFRIFASGLYTTDDVAANVSLKFKVGSNAFHTITSTAGIVTNRSWFAQWLIIVPTVGTSGTAESNAYVLFDNFTRTQYGNIYVLGNTSATAIAAQNTWYQFTQFNINGVSDGITPDHTTDDLTIAEHGNYQISCSISFSPEITGDTFEFQIFKNNGATGFTNLHSEDKALNSNDVSSVTLIGLAHFDPGDTVELWVRNLTGTGDITIKDCSLTVLSVSDKGVKPSSTTSTQSIDTTVNQTLSLTATWFSGSSGDSISIRQFLVELIN